MTTNIHFLDGDLHYVIRTKGYSRLARKLQNARKARGRPSGAKLPLRQKDINVILGSLPAFTKDGDYAIWACPTDQGEPAYNSGRYLEKFGYFHLYMAIAPKVEAGQQVLAWVD